MGKIEVSNYKLIWKDFFKQQENESVVNIRNYFLWKNNGGNICRKINAESEKNLACRERLGDSAGNLWK